MNPLLERIVRDNPECGDYDYLPEAVRQQIAPKEWLFLSDAEKAGYVRQQTEPEVE